MPPDGTLPFFRHAILTHPARMTTRINSVPEGASVDRTSTTTMRAVLSRDGTPTLATVPVPVPGPGEVLLEVSSAGMNRSDRLHVDGRYRQRAFDHLERPDIPGSEVFGRVVEVHAAVNDVAVGEWAAALTGRAHAEYVAVDARLLLPVLPGIAHADLGALPMALLTEFDAMVGLGGLRRGHRVVVTGATSGVGLLGLTLARALGAEAVIATSRSPESDSLLRQHGATEIAHDPEELSALGRRTGFDVVVDHVGGPVLEAAVEGLREGATSISVGRLGGRSATIDLVSLSSRRARLIGTTWKTRSMDEFAAATQQVRAEVLPLVQDGEITAPVAHRIAFPEIDQAYELLATERRPGKILVEMGPAPA